jgi:hypothetical protein
MACAASVPADPKMLLETSARPATWALMSSTKDVAETADICSASPVPMSRRSFWNPAFGSVPGSARPVPSPATEVRAASRYTSVSFARTA